MPAESCDGGGAVTVEPLSNSDLAECKRQLAECGCIGNICDAWGCVEVAALVAEIDRLRTELEEMRRP